MIENNMLFSVLLKFEDYTLEGCLNFNKKAYTIKNSFYIYLTITI